MTSISHSDPDENIQPLPEDNDPPFSEPTDPVADATDQTFDRQLERDNVNQPDHPLLDDSNSIDTTEAYDTGINQAAGLENPTAGNTVVDFDPRKDQSKDNEDDLSTEGGSS